MKEQVIISPIQVYGYESPYSVVSCAEYPYGIVVPSDELGSFVNKLLKERNEKS